LSSFRTQKVVLLSGFYASGDNPDVELFRHRNGRLGDGDIVRIGGDAADEVAIDF
jgi:hypothetical protein